MMAKFMRFLLGDELSSEDFFVVKLERLDNSEESVHIPR